MIARAALGLLLAGAIALLARSARALSAGGGWAAALVGTACVAAGWRWAALMAGFFITSTALSRVGAHAKELRTQGVVAKSGPRDAAQVAANGGLFAALAIASLLAPSPLWAVAAAGAIAAATADTWSTEVGTLSGGVPRSIITGRPRETGMSGAVTLAGTLAGVCGAGFIAILTLALGTTPRASAAVVAGGVVGMTVDSLLGATLQARRHCPRCDRDTEQLRHSCDAWTLPVGGLPWLDNDWVNAMSGAVGASVAWGLAAW
ncbi:MAG: DUF92 domain-containing protein [Gemmatimonadaceae bacterium]